MIIVTGGAGGIGRQIAMTLMERGLRVAVLDVAPPCPGLDFLPVIQPTNDDAIRLKDRSFFFQGDVTDSDHLDALIEKVLESAGTVHGLVNNAAITDPLYAKDMNQFDRTIAVNLRAPYELTLKVAKELTKNNGAIVNIASTRALMSEPHTEAYSASKGGLVSLTHALAMSYKGKFRVNCISPGWISMDPGALSKADHDQHPVGRVGSALDVAHVVEFLLSEKSAFITGQNFVVDGGMTKKMIYGNE